MFILSCGVFGFLLPAQVQAQTNFRSGYVLPLSGDTLRGEIDFRDGRLNAQRCRFRSNVQAEVVEYQPAQVRGYGSTAGSRDYLSFSVPTSNNATAQPHFLEVLVEGPASLYYMRDAEQREEFYLGLANQPLAILKHGFAQVVNGTERTTVIETGYRNTLAAALANCVVVERKLRTLPFQESALIKVVSTYNQECAGYKPVRAQSTAAKSHLVLGVVAGVAQQKLSYNGYPFQNGFVARDTYTGVVAGPTLRFTSGRLGQRVSIVVSALYSPEKFEVSQELNSNPSQNHPFHYNFGVTYLRVPLMVRYTVGNGKVKPFGEAGFAIGYAFKVKYTADQYDFGKSVYVPAQGPFSGSNGSFRDVETGFAGGVGVGTSVGGRVLSVQVRAERANGFSRSLDIGTSISRLYGLLSFDLTKQLPTGRFQPGAQTPGKL